MFNFSKVHVNEQLITADFILSKLTQEQIFRYYFPDFEIGTQFRSPFRIDRNPSFGFYVGKTYITASDLATGEKWNCFQFVMKMYGINFNECLKKICNDFNLIDYAKHDLLTIKPKSVLNNTKPQRKDIRICNTPFNKETLDWWDMYYIREDELVLNNCYCFSSYTILKDNSISKIDDGVSDIRTGYLTEYKNKYYWKLYQPQGKYKWVNSTPIFLPFGFQDLPFISDTLIITSSAKDAMVLRKFHTDVIGTQNESESALTLVHELPYKYKILFWDADEAGVKSASDIWDKYRYPYMNTGDSDLKDPSDYIKANGPQQTKELLKYQWNQMTKNFSNS